MTTDPRALADELERLSLVEQGALRNAKSALGLSDQRAADALMGSCRDVAEFVAEHRDAILAALRAAPGADVAAAYRAGLEAGACVVSEARFGERDNDLRSIIHAIRALPVPDAVEVTENDTADSLRDVLRQIGVINDRDGYNPEIDMLIERALRTRSRA